MSRSEVERDMSDEIIEAAAEEGAVSERLHLPPAKRTLIVLIAAAAVLLTAGVIIAVNAARSACIKPVKVFFTAVETADGEAFESILPPCVIKSFVGISPSAYYESNMLNDTLTELKDDYGGVSISFSEDSRRRLDETETDKLGRELADTYGSADEITKAYTLGISYTVKGSYKKETKYREFTVCRIGGEWYIAGVPNVMI